MALSINREKLDEFCPYLFRTLDSLGKLPLQLGWKRDAAGRPQRIAPTELEKYPRLLLGSIQRYNDVEAGFKEWESRLLRDVEVSSVREAYYPELTFLCQWMVKHKDVFTKKPNLQHLRTSLYARMFNYLYPRRMLANAYGAQQKGRKDLVEKFDRFVDAKDILTKQTALIELQRVLAEEFPFSIQNSVQKMRELYSDNEWETIVADTRTRLVANAAYYRQVLRGEEIVAPLEEEQQEAEKDEAEEVPA